MMLPMSSGHDDVTDSCLQYISAKVIKIGMLVFIVELFIWVIAFKSNSKIAQKAIIFSNL